MVAERTGTMASTVSNAERSWRAEAIDVGDRVDVRSRFIGEWARGFEVVEVLPEGYRIRRLSDGSVLPEVIPPDDVRPERRKQGFWWY
jgi:hypothetical protein